MSSSSRRRDNSPPRSGAGSSKLRMDRQPTVTRISDPSLPIGRRKEIDNVMKKARANTNDYWDKKLLEVEEKDPNRWRHSGFKKMYIEGDSSSGSDHESYRYNRVNRNRGSRSRSRSRNRKSPPSSPKRRSPNDVRRRSPQSPVQRSSRRTPEKRTHTDVRRRSPVTRSPELRKRPRSPPEPPVSTSYNRTAGPNDRSQKRILPRSRRPPSPPANSHNFVKGTRSPSNSSVSCTDDSCSVCSPKARRLRSRSNSRSRNAATSPTPHGKTNGRNGPSYSSTNSVAASSSYHTKQRPPSPVAHSRDEEKRRLHATKNHRADEKWKAPANEKPVRERIHSSRNHALDDTTHDTAAKHTLSARSSKSVRAPSLEYVRMKNPPEPDPNAGPKKKPSFGKDKEVDKRAKIKIEGEKRKYKDKSKDREKESSDSDESSSSESSFPTFAATTRLTLSERFGKMAQWSIDRSNMENMRITKDSAGGALKVMIEEDLESPRRRYSYSPAPQGHFPEELATTAPTGLMSWDDVRVRYEYYKSRGYLRDLDLKDYVKWEEWWYRYQEWLKQERYYEFYERQQLNRRHRRKKVPITQRLN